MSNTGHQPSPESRGAEHDLFVELAVDLRRFVGNRVNTSDSNVEDACSFAWIQLVVKRPGRRRSTFAWLATVAIREAWRLHRDELEEPPADRNVIAVTIDSLAASTESATDVGLEDVARALDTIHPRKRRMLLLHAAGFTFAEIAEEHGMSPERARKLVWVARLQVRERSRPD